MMRQILFGMVVGTSMFLTTPILLRADDAGAVDESTNDAAAAVKNDDFELRSRTLFDGQSLAGWEGNGAWFHINGDAIVAGRLETKIPENQFLCTTEQFDDFDLRFEARLVGLKSIDKLNAGVQIRSRRPGATDIGVPPNEMIGYQADIGTAWDRSIWGALYDESRRNVMLAEADPPVTIAVSDVPAVEQPVMTDWVSMRVVCKGTQIQIFVNGVKTVDYTETDPSIPLVGVIGLQIHSGPPSECWYRNIRILSI